MEPPDYRELLIMYMRSCIAMDGTPHIPYINWDAWEHASKAIHDGWTPAGYRILIALSAEAHKRGPLYNPLMSDTRETSAPIESTAQGTPVQPR